MLLALLLPLLFIPPLPGNFGLLGVGEAEALHRDGDGRGVDGSHQTTRRQALIDFLAELQMVEGGFVTTLEQARASANVGDTAWAVGALKVLGGLPAVDTEKIISFVADCQQPNGGFSSDPWSTYASYTELGGAIETLYHLGALDAIDQEAVIDWIMACYRPEDGGFDSRPGVYSDLIWPVADDVAVLDWLGALDRIDREKTIQYVLRFYREDEDGAWFTSTQTGQSRSLVGTSNGIPLLYRLGALNRINIPKVLNYLMSIYDPKTGVFLTTIGQTRKGVLCLELLGRLDMINATLTTEYVLSCQSHLHGSFVPRPIDVNNSNIEATQCCYDGVEVLRMLGTLDALEEEFTVEEEPVWTGDDSPPTPYQPPPPPPPGPEFWAGVGLVAVAGSVFVVVAGYGLTHRRRRRKRIVKRRVLKRRR